MRGANLTHKEYLARFGVLPPLAGGAGAAVAAAPANEEGFSSVPGLAGAVIPFTQASKPVWEEGPFWSGIVPTASDQILEPKGLPANGYLKLVMLRVETQTGGTLGAGVVNEDFPWSILRTIRMEDQGGHEIYGPLAGFTSYVATKWGGYFARSDMKNLPSFNALGNTPNATFIIPVEVAPTGLGALTNQTEATQYHVALTVASISGQYSTAPTTPPTLKIRTWCWAWPLPQAMTEPEPGAPKGRRQAQRPPLLGTIQYWTEQPQVKINNGQNRIVFNRVGQMVRTHILITRTTAGARSNAIMGNPLALDWARVRFRTIEPEVLRVLLGRRRERRHRRLSVDLQRRRTAFRRRERSERAARDSQHDVARVEYGELVRRFSLDRH
jgi:hypothetical protein